MCRPSDAPPYDDFLERIATALETIAASTLPEEDEPEYPYTPSRDEE